ncbi:uncharacterized protein Z520_10601 [Fonsecaea multimorphosa CBS 102226]|uniref:Uncharacterized protein n=1 Tax=Fonsecaea multimorphosa CBS 102226 TaxID=1442371 RepID=A0A0D2GVP3_9EURO|nr:uncharacterized protein Z520_10601 [Fonsecaea multimorphosa CBS 102226]KIX93695.1 hypothetical protein Z520_10601 [Fonsecaea multimorphosa CBS 102226]
MCHAHGRLEDDGNEAGQPQVQVEARAPSGDDTAEIAHIHHPDQGQDHGTDGGIPERVTDVIDDLPHTTPLMTIETTGALIFSGVAMHAMSVV